MLVDFPFSRKLRTAELEGVRAFDNLDDDALDTSALLHIELLKWPCVTVSARYSGI